MAKKYVTLSKLSTFLDNLKNTFAQMSHKHTISDLTDYTPITVDTALSPTSNNPVANSTLDAEFEAVSQAMNVLEQAIDGKASSTHDHNDKYYQKSEVDSALSGKSDATHDHNDSYYTKLEIDAFELITVEDIDTICGSDIASAANLTF